MAGCGADDLANELQDSLIGDEDFNIELPNFDGDDYQLPVKTGDLYGPIDRINNDDLTTRTIDGNGTFDYLMGGFKVHLKNEFEQGRITGEQYTKAYIALTESAMGNATQFLLGKDVTYWQAVNAQLAAQRAAIELVTARVAMESEKTRLQMLRYEALGRKADYALSKIRLSTESIQYCIAKYNLDEMMPEQKNLLLEQINRTKEEILSVEAATNQTVKQTELIQKDIDNAPLKKTLLEKEVEKSTLENSSQTKQNTLLDNEISQFPLKNQMLTKQVAGQEAQNVLLGKQTENLQVDIDMGPQKKLLLLAQVAREEAQAAGAMKQTEILGEELLMYPYKKDMVKEQMESQRAQTLDTRSDGTAISGSLGKQKDLYAQQITSYKRDAEMKAARVFIDAWVTMKTLDEGLAPPTGFNNTNLDQILATLKLTNNL